MNTNEVKKRIKANLYRLEEDATNVKVGRRLLGIKIHYPDSKCSNGIAHLWKEVGTNIWRCENCWEAKWMPSSFELVREFSYQSNKVGIEQAYLNQLKHLPNTVKHLKLLEMARLVRNSYSVLDENVNEQIQLLMNNLGQDKGFPNQKKLTKYRRLYLSQLESEVELLIQSGCNSHSVDT